MLMSTAVLSQAQPVVADDVELALPCFAVW